MKFPKLLPLAMLILGVALGTCPLRASVIVSSTFDTDSEGWMNGSFTSITGSPTAVNWLPTGGNPGGHIQVGDNYDWNAFYAPGKFLGNESAAYLGSLSFDLYDSFPGDPDNYPAVMISDGTTMLFSPLVAASSANGPPFQHFSVTFQASTGWTTDVNGENPATEQMLQTVLANLQVVAIDADWHVGDDDVHLDNVYLNTAVPEPGTVILLLGGVPVMLRRFRR